MIGPIAPMVKPVPGNASAPGRGTMQMICALFILPRIDHAPERTGAVWLGFVTTVQLTGALFGKQPTKLYLINTGYQFVCYLTMGAILAKWPH